MPRRTTLFTVPGVPSDALHCRDNGKTFVLTEMPAEQAEWWFERVLLAMANAGAVLPPNWRTNAGAAFARMGLESMYQLRPEVLKPLLDEMFECVQYQHAPSIPLQKIMAGAQSQIEEVSTRLKLRVALVELHTGFTGLADRLTSAFAPDSPAAPSSSSTT